MYKLENCILPAYPKTLRSFLYLLVIVLELTVFSTAPFPSLLNTYLPLTSLCPWSPSNQQPKCGYLHTLHRAPGLRAEAEKRDFTVVSNYVCLSSPRWGATGGFSHDPPAILRLLAEAGLP